MIISEKPDKISSALDVARIMQDIIAAEHETDQDREHFWAIGLNTNNKIKYIELVSLGGLDRSNITPRETFRLAMLRACKSIIVCHNHPSGNTTPSVEDRLFTKQLEGAGQILGIAVLDHIIIGDVIQKYRYYSFADEGKIDNLANLPNQLPQEPVKINEITAESINTKCDTLEKRIKKIKSQLDKRKGISRRNENIT
jgi:DNA repair protein RadC